MRRDGVDYIGVREAARRLRKAEPTVRLMLERGEAVGTKVSTESGQIRQYVSADWIEQWEAERRAA